jgi:hypothetical protein
MNQLTVGASLADRTMLRSAEAEAVRLCAESSVQRLHQRGYVQKILEQRADRTERMALAHTPKRIPVVLTRVEVRASSPNRTISCTAIRAVICAGMLEEAGVR